MPGERRLPCKMLYWAEGQITASPYTACCTPQEHLPEQAQREASAGQLPACAWPEAQAALPRLLPALSQPAAKQASKDVHSPYACQVASYAMLLPACSSGFWCLSRMQQALQPCERFCAAWLELGYVLPQT